MIEPNQRATDADAAHDHRGAPPFDMRLVVVSHVRHHTWGGRLYAYAPYAREIEVWADLFRRVVIAAPLVSAEPTADAAPLGRRNITVSPVSDTGGTSPGQKLRQLAMLPRLLTELHTALRDAEAVHVRCPGNLGLLGALVAPLYSRRLVAKYAGQWGPYDGEVRTVRLQRAILRSRWWRGPVTVYGEWANQPPHVVPFFTSVLTQAQIDHGKRSVAGRISAAPRRLLFVGRLTRSKNVHVLLHALAELGTEYPDLSLTIVGDGPERVALQALATKMKLDDSVTFTGGLEFDRVLECYETADLLVLASDTEGWPKALFEAMAFGMLCIGSNRGLIPEVLGDGRGELVEPGDADGLAARIRGLLEPPLDLAAMRRRAEWAQQHSLEALGSALEDLLRREWR